LRPGTIIGILAFVGIGGAVAAGAMTLASTPAPQPSPQGGDLRTAAQPLVQFPASNSGTKADRLSMVLASLGPAPSSPQSSTPNTTPESAVSQYADVDPQRPGFDGGAPANGLRLQVADLPSPAAKPKAPPAKSARLTNAVLNDAQIASLKQRLRSTARQERYWPEIEAALRAVVNQIYEANKKRPGATIPIDASTAEIERLKAAAMPLLMEMRADQKAEIVALARIIGMEKLAASL
jgi:hypothetical protein